jgi:lysophospholipase L1-like esterase
LRFAALDRSNLRGHVIFVALERKTSHTRPGAPPTADGSPVRRKLAAAALGIAATCAVVEILARVWLFTLASDSQFAKYAPPGEVPLERQVYRAHPYTSYCLNEAYRSHNGLNRHNSLGYRGDEITREKKPGVHRILCLGGSTTYEIGVPDYRESFTVQLEQILCERRGQRDIEVINAGCPGWNSWESLVDLEFRGLDLKPDLVVVYCGCNEVHARMVPPTDYRRDDTGFRKSWHARPALWERSAALRRIGVALGIAAANSVGALSQVDYADKPEPFATLAANSTDFYADNLEDMIAVSRAHGADVLIATWAWSPNCNDYASHAADQQGFREINDTSREVAARRGVALFDFVAAMPTDPSYWRDGAHVNAKGARTKAELFADFIQPRWFTKR